MHHLSVSWHIIPLKCSSWKICFGQRESIKVQFFRLLIALMKVDPIPQANFEKTRPGFIQILHHGLVSGKITPPNFLAQTSYNLDKKSPLKFSDFWVFGWKFTKFLMSVLWEITLLYFFSSNIKWFGQRSP